MNRTVKLYQSVKRNKNWGTEPVPDTHLKNLKDLPEGQGNFYLGFYESTRRRMTPVGRFADVAKQKLMRKRGELEMGLEPPTRNPKLNPTSKRRSRDFWSSRKHSSERVVTALPPAL